MINKIKKHNENKFKLEPNNKITVLYPLLISPIISVIFISIILLVFIGLFVVVNPDYLAVSASLKGSAVFGVMAMVFPLILFLSYMYTWLIIYPISFIMKHRNTRKFELILGFISFMFTSMVFYFLYKENGSNVYLPTIVSPLIIFTITFLNIYTFKSMNEIFKRDERGRIVYSKK